MTQTTTTIGRSQFANPNLGYDVTDGGTNLHAALTAMHTAASNNLSARWFTAQVIANSGYVDLTHNFGLTSINDIGVHLYQSNAEVAIPTGVSLTAQSSNVLRISNASGGSLTFDVLISAVPDVTKYAQTFSGLKTFSSGISTDTIVEKTAGAGVTFTRGSAVTQTFNPAAAQDIQSVQKRTGLACLAAGQYAYKTATIVSGNTPFTVISTLSMNAIGVAGGYVGVGANTNELCLFLYKTATGFIATNKVVSATDTTNDTAIHTICGVYDGSNIKLYTDGVYKSTSAAGTITFGAGTTALAIGEVPSGSTNNSQAKHYRMLTFNYALPEDKVRRYSAGERLDWEDLSGSMTPINSATADQDFSSDTGWWTKAAGVSIGSNICSFANVVLGDGLYKTGVLTVGKSYKLKLKIISYTDGSIGLFNNSAYYAAISTKRNGVAVTTSLQTSGTVAANDIWEFEFTVINDTALRVYTGVAGTDLAIDDLTVIQLGALAAYEGENLLPSAGIWPDSSGNANDLTITGATTINKQDSLELTDKLIVGGVTKIGSNANIQHEFIASPSGGSGGIIKLIGNGTNGTMLRFVEDGVKEYFVGIADGTSVFSIRPDSPTAATFLTIADTGAVTVGLAGASTTMLTVNGEARTTRSMTVKGAYVGNEASAGMTDFSSGAMRFLSYGANDSTAGLFTFIQRSSAATIDRTVLSIDSAGAWTVGPTTKNQYTTINGNLKLDSNTGSNTRLDFYEDGVAKFFIYQYHPDDTLRIANSTGTDHLIIASTGAVTVGPAVTAGVAGVQHAIRTGDQATTNTFTHGEIHFANGASSLAYPAITSATTDTNSVGLWLCGAANDTNSGTDMAIEVRESDTSDGTDFATLTNTAFTFRRYNTDLVTIKRNGNFWAVGDVSALSFTDRTPYPESHQEALDAINSFERLPNGDYEKGNKSKQLNHSKTHSFVKGKDGNRDLSATVSCLIEVVKELKKEVDKLKKDKPK